MSSWLYKVIDANCAVSEYVILFVVLIRVSYKEEIRGPLITTKILSVVWSQFTTYFGLVSTSAPITV
jgi:hypothetical protein